jgi:hypothetical protein
MEDAGTALLPNETSGDAGLDAGSGDAVLAFGHPRGAAGEAISHPLEGSLAGRSLRDLSNP